MKIPKPERKQQELPDADIHNAICCLVYDLGHRVNDRFGKIEHVIRIAWELEQKMKDGRPFMMSQRYTLSMGSKSNLRKAVEAWRARKMTDAEAYDFDTDILIGKPCRLNVVHNTSEATGFTYANVGAVLPASKSQAVWELTNTEAPEWFKAEREENEAGVRRFQGAGHEGGPDEGDDPDEGRHTPPPKAGSGFDEIPFMRHDP